MKSAIRLLTVLLLCLSFMCTLYPAALAEGNGEDCEVILTQNWGDFGAALSELVREGMDEVHAAGYGGRYETARLIVKMRGELPDLSRFAPKTILRDPENHYLIQFASPQEAENCADFLAALDDVIYVEPDSIVSISDSDESADTESAADVTTDPDEAETVQTETAAEEPDAAEQEPDISADMPDTETTQSDGEGEAYPEPLDEADALAENDNSVYSTAKSWGVAAIHADEYAADLVSRGKTGFIAVAVVDSGVDLSHPMLSGRLLDGYDFVDSDAIPQDEHSHGTHVSGIIVDSTPGLNINILPVRVLNAEGKGSSSAIALGVRYAADNGANVINLSLGGEHNNYKEEAIEYAMQKGITVVASAGNDGVNIGTDCPAHIAGCITVASVNQSLNRSSFSNYGSTVDIAAPGENIYSSVLNGSYGYKDGTSMAAPYVSAAAAMLMCDNPGANVASLLCGVATDLGAAGWDSYYGAGFLNLESFVQSGPKHYTVAYNANGGSGAPASQRKTAGQALTLANGRPVRMDSSTSLKVKLDACGGSVSKSTLTASAKIRYAFQGWNTMDDGSGTDYAPRASYTADESVTLFAQWTESYYDVEALELPTAAREGYTFLGWADSPDAESGLTGSYTPEADTELYAIWVITGALNDNISWTLFGNGKLSLSGTGQMNAYTSSSPAPWNAYKEEIKQVVIPSGVTSIGAYAFDSCSGLTSVTIPAGVTSIGDYAFDGCSGLTSVTIPEGVTSIGKYAFSGCNGLMRVTIPNSVTSVSDHTFDGCSGLTSVTIPNSVTSIRGNAFRGCSCLASVAIPESVTSIGDRAFYDCSGLISVTIPNSVTSIGSGAFSGCCGLKTIRVDDGNNRYCAIDGCLFSIERTMLLCCPAGKSGNVTIPDSVTSIGDYAFDGCSVLTSVKIPNSVRSIGDYAFRGCSGLTSVTIPDGVTSIGSSAFDGCSSLTSVTIPNSVTSIGSYAFEDCSGLEAVNISDLTCWLQISFSNLYSNPLNYANRLYLNGEEVTALVIPEGVTSIGAYAFFDCRGLTSVTIPEGVTAIGNSAFSGCIGLSRVLIPASVTSIDNWAFYRCSGLTSVTIPESVTSIGDYAFSDCSGLTSIRFAGNMPSISSSAFSSVNATAYYFIEKSNYTADNMLNYGGTLTWEPDYSHCYTVSYNANGGTGAPGAQYKTRGQELSLSSTVPAYAGYEFLGWATSPSADSAVYQPGDPYTQDADITLYAVWKVGILASGTCGETLNWTLDPLGMLTISGAGRMSDYRYSSAPWSAYCSEIKQLAIQDGVTSIGGYAFPGCSVLTSVTIPEGVNSIGDYAFDGCRGLTSVTIPNSVTSIGSYAFRGCSGLKAVNISDLSCWLQISFATVSFTSNPLYYAHRLYLSGKELTTVVIPEGVTSIGDYAFYGCSGLTSVTIPESVTSIGSYAFSGCSGLRSIRFSGNMPSISSDAFYTVRAAAYYYAENSTYIAENMLNYGGTLTWEPDYSHCYRVSFDANGGAGAPDTQFKMPGQALGLSAAVPTYEDYKFLGWAASPSAESATYQPGDAYTQDANITLYAVWKVRVLASGTCGETLNWALNQLGALTISGTGNMDDYLYSGSAPWYDYRDQINRLVIPAGVTSIGDKAFEYCNGLTSVTIPDSVTSIGSGAFKGCSGLTSVTIPDSVTSIDIDAFDECRGLEAVNISDLTCWINISFGEFISNPLYYAHRLYLNGKEVTELVIPEGVTSIGKYVFLGCSGLTSVAIPDSVTSIGGYAFYGCSGLTSVAIPDSVTSIGSYAFRDCSGLTSVTIPNSVTSIRGKAFCGCSCLASVAIPDSVTSIGDSAFYDCSGLTSVTIPNSVTFIDDFAFYGCSGLTSVTIGNGVTSIGEQAFYGCSGLTDIYFTSNMPSFYSNSFENVTATAYYPEGATGYDQPGSFGGTLTWQSYVLYRIVYNAGSGTAARTTDPVAAGNSITLPTAQREGYAFLGWAESDDALSAQYEAGETFTPTESMTLYAVWQLIIPEADGILPAGLRELEDEALAGTLFHVVRLPEGMTRIGSRVFDGCTALIAVYVPTSVTDIAADAFEGAPDTVVIVGSADSAAQRFAATHGITFQLG